MFIISAVVFEISSNLVLGPIRHVLTVRIFANICSEIKSSLYAYFYKLASSKYISKLEPKNSEANVEMILNRMTFLRVKEI